MLLLIASGCTNSDTENSESLPTTQAPSTSTQVDESAEEAPDEPSTTTTTELEPLPEALQEDRPDWSQVRAVNIPSAEWACIDGTDAYDPNLLQSLDVLQSIKDVNAIRLPLNQYCWVNNTIMSDGMSYQDSIVDLIDNEFATRGFDVIIDLHTSGPNNERTKEQAIMPDAQNSPLFWEIAGELFADNDAVIAFELFNEPIRAFDYPEDATPAQKRQIDRQNWECWRDGCVTQEGWEAAGMQSMVDAARSNDAEQDLIANGLEWANDMSGWLEYRPDDPLDRLVAGFHVYDLTACNNPDCWDRELLDIVAEFPLAVTEFGSRRENCTTDVTEWMMEWADTNGVGYAAWAWFPGGCGFPSLISDWSGTFTDQGAVLCERLGGSDCQNRSVEESTQPAIDLDADVPPGTSCFVSFMVPSGDPFTTPTCSNGVVLQVDGTSLAGWNGQLTSWEVQGDWDVTAYWAVWVPGDDGQWFIEEDGLDLWDGPGNGNYAEMQANDRMQTLDIVLNGAGSLTIYSDEFSGTAVTFYVE